MKITLPTHPEITLTDPEYTWTCIDDPQAQTFTPAIHFEVENEGVQFTAVVPLSPQPYVDGTWYDEDVENAIQDYLLTIKSK